MTSQDEKVDGPGVAAKLLNSMPPEHKKRLLERIRKADPKVFETIQSNIFLFEDIKDITDQGLQRLIKSADHHDLVVSLKLADEQVKKVLFRNMSQRKLELVMEDLSLLPQTPKAEVEDAQKRILHTIENLRTQGLIVRRDDDQTL